MGTGQASVQKLIARVQGLTGHRKIWEVGTVERLAPTKLVLPQRANNYSGCSLSSFLYTRLILHRIAANYHTWLIFNFLNKPVIFQIVEDIITCHT